MNVLVVGDTILDINYFSNIYRVAPEADIPIHNIDNIDYKLGGALNVAKNLKSLNVNVRIISVIGNEYRETINMLCNDIGLKTNFIIDNNRKTTQKHRIINSNSIKVRFDIEDTHDISYEIYDNVINYVKSQQNIDAILISDYDKGVITEKLCQEIIEYSNKNNILTFVDPKTKNYLKYKDCFCFKPNLNESKIITHTEKINEMFDFLKYNLNPKHILITAGCDGMYLDSIDNHIAQETIDVVDVTGAGDCVITTLLYCFLKYKNIDIACRISNYIAGQSVKVIGNYNISIDEIKEKYNELTDSIVCTSFRKILFDTDVDKLMTLKKNNNKVVFTNGCFDIMHSAHLKMLNFCKKQGDILIVGLNSDESIKRLKGNSRPINGIDERSEFLANLSVVDHVVIFNDDTPYNIINLIKPDILVKGGDYNINTIIGSEIVDSVLIYDYETNKSTTNVINKILMTNTNN